MKRTLTCLAILPVLAGCATAPWEGYWQKPTKYKEMPKYERGVPAPDVPTLSLDASRRLVIAQKKNGERFTCPEPPPDVAVNKLDQVIAAIKDKTGNELSYGASSQAINQVLSGRTSVVEFWRTTSSMYCVLLMNQQGDHASAYLNTAQIVANRLNDANTTNASAAAFIDGLTGSRAYLEAQEALRREQAAKKAAEEKAAADAKAKAQADAAKVAAKVECDKVPQDQKATNDHCKKAAA